MNSPEQQRILIVDDNPKNIRVLFDILRQDGLQIAVAKSGESALLKVHKAFPDLILLDAIVPGIDGFETCRRLKADPQTRSIPVIFLSALDDVAKKVEAFRIGGVDYITKPFQVQEVLARVRTQLALQAAQTQMRQLSVAVENAAEGIARLDDRGRYTSANRAYANMVGYQPEAMIGMEWQETVHPDDLEKMQAAYRQMRSNGNVEIETKGVRKDGSIFYKQLGMTAAYDKQGQFIGHYCFMKDISDRSCFFRYCGQNHFCATHAWWRDGSEPSAQPRQNISVETFPWFHHKILAGKAFHISNLAALPVEAIAEKVEFERHSIASLLNVPMLYAGKVVGFLELNAVNSLKTWGREEIDLLKLVGN